MTLSEIGCRVLRCRDDCAETVHTKEQLMFFQLAEVLPAYPTPTWDLSKQLGVSYAVGPVPSDDDGNPTADFTHLLWQKERFRQAGIDLVVLETAFPWAQHAKFGGP